MGALLQPRTVGTVPVLLARPVGRPPFATVLWFHGFTASKETDWEVLEQLANAGCLAVGGDNAGHGERRLLDFQERFRGTREENDRDFYRLVAQTCSEVPDLLDRLCAEGLADRNRLGVAGVSMGAHIAYGVTVRKPRLRAAVALLGSPYWRRPDRPSGRLDHFYPTALLSLTAGRDEVVPPAGTAAFHTSLTPYYKDAPERLRYEELAGQSHMMKQAAWDHVVHETVHWHLRFTLQAH